MDRSADISTRARLLLLALERAIGPDKLVTRKPIKDPHLIRRALPGALDDSSHFTWDGEITGAIATLRWLLNEGKDHGKT